MTKKETIERLTIKLPKSIATYFREEFPHGERSKFVAKTILDYKHAQEVEAMEQELKKIGKVRQQ